MEELAQQRPDISNVKVLSRKSWIIYVKVIIGCLSLLAIIFVITNQNFLVNYSKIKLVLYALMLIIIVICLYEILYLRSFVLYYDDDGVWSFKGILPWNRGVSGVKWGDLDEAVFYTGFFSWIFKSHKINISHKYTKSSEIIHKDMNNGVKAVDEINSKLKDILKR